MVENQKCQSQSDGPSNRGDTAGSAGSGVAFLSEVADSLAETCFAPDLRYLKACTKINI
jgi:hypothetical protein